MSNAEVQQQRRFERRWLRRSLVCLGAFVLLLVIFYGEEDWRGRRDWNQYRKTKEAAGEHLDFSAYIPKPVPDNDNFAAAPIVKSLLQSYDSCLTNDLFARADNHVFRTNLTGYLGRRHFLDLVAWKTAWVALQTGKLKDGQTFQTDQAGLAEREAAAKAVLDGMKPDEPAFVELRLASQRAYCRYAIQYDAEDPAQIMLTHVVGMKRLCQRLNLQSCAELAAGQTDKSLADAKLALYLADSINEPFVICYLVRAACFQISTQPVWEGLADRRWSDSQLRELQQRFEQYNFLADLDRPLKEERTFGIRELEHYKKKGLGQLVELSAILHDDLDGIGEATWPKGFLNLLGRVLPAGWYDEELLTYCTMLDAQFNGVIDAAGKRVFPSRAASNDVDLNRQIPDASVPLSASAILRHQGMASGLRFLRKLAIKAAAAQTVANQGAIACALERYRLANRHFPETLDALAPRFMSRLPKDVITGQPCKYRRTNDGQFILYSVGWNEKDDGGVPGKTLFDETQGEWVWTYPGL